MNPSSPGVRYWWSWAVVIAATVAYAVVYSVLNCLKYAHFDWSTIDVANNLIWYDLVFSPSHPLWAIHGSSYVTGLLIQPAAIVMAVLHRVIGSPYLLLALPPAMVAMGIPALFALARIQLKNDAVALAAAAAYALNPFINLESLFGFRYDALALPFVIAVPLARRLGKRRWFWAALLAGNALRLNVALVNAIYCALAARRTRSQYLVRAFAACVAWLAVAIAGQIVLSVAWPSKVANDIPVGHMVGELVRPALADPLAIPRILTAYFAEGRGAWICQYLVPVLMLPLAAPGALIPAAIEALNVAAAAAVFASYLPGLDGLTRRYGYEFLHMAVILVGYLHIASIQGAGRILNWFPARDRVWPTAFAALWLAVAAAYHYAATPPIFGPIPLARGFTVNYYVETEHVRNMRAAFDSLPTQSTVLMSGVFCERAETAGRKRYYLKAWQPDKKADFDAAIVDLFSFELSMTAEERLDRTLAILALPDFGVTRFDDGIVVARRGADRARNSLVAAYLEANRDWLKRDLLSPYASVGGRAATADRGAPYYSLTQFLPEDRALAKPIRGQVN